MAMTKPRDVNYAQNNIPDYRTANRRTMRGKRNFALFFRGRVTGDF